MTQSAQSQSANAQPPAPQASGSPGQPLATVPTTTADPVAMVLGNDAFRVGLEPTTLNDAMVLADLIASTGICGVSTAADALVRMLTGRGLGLSTMQSLRGVYIVKGKPSLDAALMQAICLKSSICDYFVFVSGDDKQATYKTRRKGSDERVLSFTLEDAQKQGLLEKGKDEDAKSQNNWVRMPKQMLRARAKSELARLEYPDLLYGMYSREELEATEEEEREWTPGPTDGSGSSARGAIDAEFVDSRVNAARRDWNAEANALKARIAAATSRQARAEVRDAVKAWDAPEPFMGQVKEAYNESVKTKATNEAPAAAPPAVGTATNPSAIPEGGLFAGEPKDAGK